MSGTYRIRILTPEEGDIRYVRNIDANGLAGIIDLIETGRLSENGINAAIDAAIESNESSSVSLDTAQTISGPKTFLTAITVPDGSFTIGKVQDLGPTLDGKADLVDGKIPASQIPSFALGDVFVVNSQAAMLASPAGQGDTAIRTDISKTYVLASNSPATLADWKEIITTSTVTSVAGRTGNINLTKNDVGLPNVDNTSDLAKPVSTATQAALDTKAADAAVVKTSGNQTIAGTKTFSSVPVVPDSSFTIGKTTGLQAALDAKATTAALTSAVSAIPETVRDTMGAALVQGPGISIVSNDTTDTITIGITGTENADNLPLKAPTLFASLSGLRDTRVVPVVVAGASVAAGITPQHWVYKFNDRLQKAYPRAAAGEQVVRTLSTAVSDPPTGTGVVVVNAAVGGTGTANFLTSTTRAQVMALKPAAVIISDMPANDYRALNNSPAVVKANMIVQLTDLIAKQDPNFPCQIIVVGGYYPTHPTPAGSIIDYRTAMREACAQFPGKVIWADTYDDWVAVGVGSGGSEPLDFLVSDNVHPNANGHKVIADSVARLFGLPDGIAEIDATVPPTTSIVTSDTFSGAGTAAGRATDVGLGGTPKSWIVSGTAWTVGSGGVSPANTTGASGMVLDLGISNNLEVSGVLDSYTSGNSFYVEMFRTTSSNNAFIFGIGPANQLIVAQSSTGTLQTWPEYTAASLVGKRLRLRYFSGTLSAYIDSTQVGSWEIAASGGTSAGFSRSTGAVVLRWGDFKAELITADTNGGGTGGPATWGNIGGTLNSQTDLTAALDSKVSKLADPNADRIRFWDDSAGQEAWLSPGSGITITGTTISAAGGGGGLSGYEALFANVVGDGVADDRAAIQAIIDAGYNFVGRYGGKYRIVGCLFYDRTSLFQQPFMEPVGELIFDNMPQVQRIDPATGANDGALLPRVGIAVGWKREAWNQTTNIVKLAESGTYTTKAYFRNSSTDDDGTPMGFELRNCRIVAPAGTSGGTGTTSTSEANAIVVQSIVGGLRFKNVIFGFFRSLSSWFGYTDVHTLDGCHIDGPTGYFDADGENGSSLLEQRDYGDAISIRNCKTNGGWLAKLFRARGAVIESYVTGRILLKDCEDILVIGGHDERNISSNDGVTIIRSSVTFFRMQMYARDTQGGTKTLHPNIIIDDDNNGSYDDVGSSVVFRDFHHVRRIESSNQTHSPLIYFQSTHRNTEIIADGLEAYEVTNLSAGQSRRSPIHFATSAVSQVTTALADKTTQIMIAGGRFVFSPIAGAWQARNLDRRMSYDAPPLTVPDLIGLGSGGTVAGSLGNAVSHSYAVSLENAPGRMTNVVSKTTLSGASGAVIIEVRDIDSPCILHIWRSTTDAVAAPTHYLAAPVHTRDIHGWDLGTTIFGRTWQTTGIPARPATNTTANVQIINGVEKAV